nr:zinc knuckle CX2CX4HX4C [Tanacetum cinerariifolium]
MKDDLRLQRNDLPIWLTLKIKFEGLTTANTPHRYFFIRQRNQDDPHDDAHPEGENSAKRQKTSEHGTYVIGESSSGQANKSESDSSTSNAVDEAKLRKVVAEMLRQRCTSGDEHQCHIDQMEKFLKNDIVRSNGSIVSITEPNYKNLNKNDIEDMYLLCINRKVGDYAETGLLWSLSVFIRKGSNDVNTASVNLDTSTADLIKVTGLTTASHTSTTEANVPNDPDYDVWLPLDLVHEVNDKMKNFLYGYFISKRLAFPVVEWFVRNNWEKYGLTKVMMVRGFFFFKFSSLEGIDSVIRDGPWMIRGILIFLINGPSP